MKRACLLLLCLAAAPLAARDAASVVLGDTAESCDCPVTPTPAATATPLPSPVPAAPQPTPTPVNLLQQDIQSLGFPVTWEGDVLLVTLADERTRFDTAKATLKDESVARLRSLAAVLLKHPGNAIRIDGHTDNAGKAAFNQGLSLRRAQAVEATLKSMGVPAADIEAVTGHGPDLPVGDNSSEEGRAMNRRVELRLRFHGLQSGAESSHWVSGTAAALPQAAASPVPSVVPTAEAGPAAPAPAPLSPSAKP